MIPTTARIARFWPDLEAPARACPRSASEGWSPADATVAGVDGDDVLAFAERILSLIETTHYTTTYKLATLLAILDLLAEHTDPGAGVPDELSGLEVGRRVVELYWPQSAPYASDGSTSAVLAQSRQNDIPAKLAAWRREHGIEAGATVDDARARTAEEWEQIEARLAATIVRMPLPKLQRFGEGSGAVEDRFLYDFTWRDEVAVTQVLGGSFDDRISFRPGVAERLVRLSPLLRPVLQARWAGLVAARNPDVVDAHQLDEFLFGASRVSLDRVRSPLVDAQAGRCFYCRQGIRGDAAVDHFIPWSRHPDNTLDNLVAAHASCNESKSSSLAALDHLERWMDRFEPGSSTDELVGSVAHDVGWPRRPDRTLAAARASYLWLPSQARLWSSRRTLEPVEHDRLRAVLR